MKTKQTTKKKTLNSKQLPALALRFTATFGLASAVIAAAAHWAVLIAWSASLHTVNVTGGQYIDGSEFDTAATIDSSVYLSMRIVVFWAFVSLLATAILLFVASERREAARTLFHNLAWLSACVLSVVFSQAILRSAISVL